MADGACWLTVRIIRVSCCYSPAALLFSSVVQQCKGSVPGVGKSLSVCIRL